MLCRVEGLTSSLVFSYNTIVMLRQDFSAKSFVDYIIDLYSPFGSQEVLTKRAASEFSNPQKMGCCKEGVSNIFRLDGGQQKGKGGQQHILSSKIMDIFKAANADKLTDEMRRDALRILDSRRTWLKAWYDEVGWRIFEGLQRGSQRYCKMYRHKIIDTTQSMIDRGGQLMALTATYNAKGYTANRLDAWKNYRKALSHLMKEIKRNYKCEYVSVLESTKNGYPHAHVILAFPEGTISYYNKLKNNKALKYGKLFNIVKKHGPAPQFKLCAIKGNNTAWYLTKYISKGEKEDIFALLKKDGRYTTNERKLIDCLIYCIACESRQVCMSYKPLFFKEKDNAAGQSDASPAKESGTAAVDTHPDHDPPAEEKSPPTAADLMTRCNNLPSHCLHHIFMMMHPRKLLLFGDLDGRAIENDYEKQKLFEKRAAIVGCGGCIFAEFAKAKMKNNFTLFNVTYWGKDYRRHKWFDGIDPLDGAAVVDAWERLWTFYLAAVSSHKYTTSEFFGIGKYIGLNPFNLAGVTKMTKNHYKLHQNKVDELWRLDDYERKMIARESREEINY